MAASMTTRKQEQRVDRKNAEWLSEYLRFHSYLVNVESDGRETESQMAWQESAGSN